MKKLSLLVAATLFTAAGAVHAAPLGAGAGAGVGLHLGGLLTTVGGGLGGVSGIVGGALGGVRQLPLVPLLRGVGGIGLGGAGGAGGTLRGLVGGVLTADLLDAVVDIGVND